MSTRYKVVAPFVNIRSETAAKGLPSHYRNQRYAVGGHIRGTWVPEDSHPEDIERLLGLGMIEPVPDS